MDSLASGKAELRQLNWSPRYLIVKIASYKFNFLLGRASVSLENRCSGRCLGEGKQPPWALPF